MHKPYYRYSFGVCKVSSLSIVCVTCTCMTIFFASRQAKWMKQEPEYYCDDPDLPIFQRIHASRKQL